MKSALDFKPPALFFQQSGVLPPATLPNVRHLKCFLLRGRIHVLIVLPKAKKKRNEDISLTSFLNPLLASLCPATGAGPHQPIYLQPATVHGRTGAGEHAEALQPGHFHAHPPRRQRNQPRSGLRQVQTYTVHSHVLGQVPEVD